MNGYKAIIRDGLILMAISAVFALVFKLGFDQLRGVVEDDPLITASLQDNIDMMINVLSEESFKKKPQGANSYEEFTKFMTNKQDEQKRTPLMWVSYMNFSDREIIKNKEEKRLVAAKLLLEKNANLSLKDEHDWTALTWASWTGMATLVSLFADNGADVDAADVKGQTPLMIASIRGNDEVVAVLLEKGAQRELKSSDGKTALDFAQEYINRYPERKSSYEKIIAALQTVVKAEEAQPAVKEEAPAEEDEEEE